MANIFDVTNERNNDVRQNPFDWSHQSNLTGRLGFIYPFFADVVPAKTSYRCTPRLGLQFMPMVFPVQTRMKARVSFFRVPLRTLWKDYKDYIGNFKQGLVEPYLDLATSFEKFMGTGKLADFLNIPTVLVGDYAQSLSLDFELPYHATPVITAGVGDDSVKTFMPCQFPDGVDGSSSTFGVGSSVTLDAQAGSSLSDVDCVAYCCPVDVHKSASGFLYIHNFKAVFPTFAVSDISPADYLKGECRFVLIGCETSKVTGAPAIIRSYMTLASARTASFKSVFAGGVPYDTFSIPEDAVVTENISVNSSSSLSYYLVCAFYVREDTTVASFPQVDSFLLDGAYRGNLYSSSCSFSATADELPNAYHEITRETSPYFDSTSRNKDRQLKLAAYTARAYEAIYNAYMRDNRNNPYYRNGQLEYNVWIPTDEGGADTYPYELHRANWEKDFLTTAVPSPQQGRAPLVGLTSYTTAEEVDGITQTSLRLALVDEDGKRYALRFSSDTEGVNGVDYAELGDGVAPQALSFRSLVDAASTGISIPDLRMVNAYQKFLELNMRKGYSYKEIVEGRFDCQVRYDDLNIPEFLGGFTRDVNMNRVVQSVERDPSSQYPAGSYANALGSLAGDAFLAAEGQPISCFCDEESVIMGLISIVPVPNYSQLLPKHYLYRDLLDHFQPEFDNLGFQPITYKEVCPVQAFNAGDDLNGTFGYQRAWYDLVQRTDQVHGLFRTQLRDFLMNRVFDAKPTLTKSFLLVDDEQLNDVFAVTETTDKFTGQIWMDCQVKLPVSRVSIPRLD